MKLAITQMVLGGLIAVVSFIATRWGYTTSFTFPPDESGLIKTVEVMPGIAQVSAQASAFLAILLGLAVLGCGVAQFLAAKKALRG
jgi:hypothetical protein